jgi:regulator of sirC expression with transglutaminase-like and TPR domain
MTGNGSSELNALLRLLDDGDRRVATAVDEKILTYGDTALAVLQEFSETGDEALRNRVSRLLAQISSERFLKEILEIQDESENAEDGDVELERGVASIARFGYPLYEQTEMEEVIGSFAKRLQARLSLCATHGEVLKVITYFFTCEEMFAGSGEDYYNPDNSFINKVMENRRGIQISLSVVWILTARRLGLPILGINLPGHFMLKYDVPNVDIYIDPFNGGKLLSRLDCIRFMVNAGYKFSEQHLTAATNRQILIRMLNNLAEIYTQKNDELRAEPVRKAATILSHY